MISLSTKEKQQHPLLPINTEHIKLGDITKHTGKAAATPVTYNTKNIKTKTNIQSSVIIE